MFGRLSKVMSVLTPLACDDLKGEKEEKQAGRLLVHEIEVFERDLKLWSKKLHHKHHETNR